MSDNNSPFEILRPLLSRSESGYEANIVGGKEIKNPCTLPVFKTSHNDWDYNATADIYCPHCYGIQGYDVRKHLPEEDGLANVISCQHCEMDFAVRGVQTIVWDVATDLRSLCDDELGPKE